jgi:hypothetical protein
VCGVNFARAREAQVLRVMIVMAIGDASHGATRAYLCGNVFRACGLLPRNPQQVLKSRLLNPRTGDPSAEGGGRSAAGCSAPPTGRLPRRAFTSPGTRRQL